MNTRLLVWLILTNVPQLSGCLLQDVAIRGTVEGEVDAEPVETWGDAEGKPSEAE